MKNGKSGVPEQGREVALRAGQFLRIRKGGGCRVICQSGVVLATASGVAQDFDLHAHGEFLLPNDGLVLIEAIGDADLLLHGPSRAGIGWRAAVNRLTLALANATGAGTCPCFSSRHRTGDALDH
nr:hypothetical protein [uncultured Noviherbaspirillum sp.]